MPKWDGVLVAVVLGLLVFGWSLAYTFLALNGLR